MITTRHSRFSGLGIYIVAGAMLIAASVLVVGRYSIGHVEVFNDDRYIVYGIDSWTGDAFRQMQDR